MSRFRSGVLAAMLAVLGLLGTNSVGAEEASADALFDEGRAELTKGNYESACDKLRRSDHLDPAPGTKLNLAECEALRGRIATAYALLLEVERLLPASDVRVPVARSKRERLEPRLPKLNVTLAPEAPQDTQLRIGARLLTPAEYGTDIPWDPGSWEVSVTAAGFAENRFQLVTEEGKLRSIVAQPLPRVQSPLLQEHTQWAGKRAPARSTSLVGPQHPKSIAPSTQPLPHQKSSSSTAPTSSKGIIALGLGISATTLATVSGILTLQAKSDNDAHCNEVSQTCDADGRQAASRGRVFGALTTVGLVAGALGIGLGIYWISNGEHTPHSAAITLRSDAQATLLELKARL